MRYFFAAWFIRILLGLRYRVAVTFLGTARQAIQDQSTGTFVIINHPTWGIEGAKVFSELALLGVKPLLVVAKEQLENPILGTISKFFDVVEIPDMTQRGGGDIDTLRKATAVITDALNAGKSVFIAGSGRIYRSRFETMGSMTAQVLATKPNARIITGYADGLWGSRFSFAATGQYPELGKNILHGIFAFIANFGFFPKHPWKLTFEEHAITFQGKSASQINDILKDLFNTTESGPGHPRMGMRYRLGWWDDTVPVPDPVIAQMAGDIDAVNDEVRRATVDKIVEITKDRKLSELSLDSPALLSRHLRDDVGMDSLATADFLLWVEEFTEQRTGTRFQVENTDNLITVKDAMLAANGLTKVEGGTRIALPSPKWLEPPSNKRLVYKWDGVPFPHAWLKSALKNPRQVIIADPNFGSPTQRKLLQVMLAVYPTINELPGERVGILLPSGVPAFAALQAIRLSGKIPVLLNHTTGLDAVKHAVRITGITHVLTSSLVLSKIEWGDREKEALGIEWVEFEKVKASLRLGDKLKILFGSLFGGARKLLKNPLSPEVAILVTSGSEGLPKSIALTDEMVGLFLQELITYFDIHEGDRLLQTGPPFHVLGFLAGVALPSIVPIKVGLIPNPTDYKALATLTELYQLNLAVSPPAFAEGMAAASMPGQLKSLELLVYGAQAMSVAQREVILAKAPHVQVREGYGLTECTGGLAFEHQVGGEQHWFELLRTVDYRLVDLETGEITNALGKTGILHVRGPTVIQSYLQSTDPALRSPDKAFVELNGETFFRTGDLLESHRTVPRYFRYVTRVSRTYKDKAGEFINPDLIQEALAGAFPRVESDAKGPLFAVTGAKQAEGYTLSALFTTRDLTLDEANHAVFSQGLAPILRVYKLYRVKAIPLAGSGKLSLSTIERWANELEKSDRSQLSADLKAALV